MLYFSNIISMKILMKNAMKMLPKLLDQLLVVHTLLRSLKLLHRIWRVTRYRTDARHLYITALCLHFSMKRLKDAALLNKFYVSITFLKKDSIGH